MIDKDAIPVIVGVGEFRNASLHTKDALEPMQLMLEAIQHAAQDTRLPASTLAQLLTGIDCINVVHTWSWPYADLPGLLASKLMAHPAYKHYSEVGGDKPVKLIDDALRKIVFRKIKLAVVTGGEALASLSNYMATEKRPPPSWTTPDMKALTLTTQPKGFKLPRGISADHGIGYAIQIYPLYENGFRHHQAQSITSNHEESANLYAEFAQVAAQNPAAWNYGKRVPLSKDIGEVQSRNRIISFPYTLLMNAFNTVNMAAACILTSTERAKELGIPEDRWIYLLGAAGTCESSEFWKRENYFRCNSLSQSIDATLNTSNLPADDLDLLDIYSCFPIVPKLAAIHLGLPIINSSKPLTVLGGLTSFGGAGNNYSLHAVAEMTRLLRKGRGRHGLVLANGGYLTHHHAVCLSAQPPKPGHSFPAENPLPPLVDQAAVPAIDLTPEGDASIETYTVDFDRNGQPLLGHVVGRLCKSNARFVANNADQYTLEQLASWSKEPIGRFGLVSRGGKGNNLFKLTPTASI